MDNEFRKLIQLICSENNISCDVLSLGFLLVLEKNGVVKTISGYKFDNNSHSLGKIFDDLVVHASPKLQILEIPLALERLRKGIPEKGSHQFGIVYIGIIQS